MNVSFYTHFSIACLILVCTAWVKQSLVSAALVWVKRSNICEYLVYHLVFCRQVVVILAEYCLVTMLLIYVAKFCVQTIPSVVADFYQR